MLKCIFSYIIYWIFIEDFNKDLAFRLKKAEKKEVYKRLMEDHQTKERLGAYRTSGKSIDDDMKRLETSPLPIPLGEWKNMKNKYFFCKTCLFFEYLPKSTFWL